MRVVVGVTGYPGHALPALAFARGLRARGHDVVVASDERWRAAVEGFGAVFSDDLARFGSSPDPANGTSPGDVAERARALRGAVEAVAPELVVSDVFTPAVALAAELAGVARATLIPVPYPGQAAGAPPHELGLLPPRTALGKGWWRGSTTLASGLLPAARWLRGGSSGLGEIRARLGLRSLDRQDGVVTDGLTLVANLPQLEYPQAFPSGVHVTGPMFFDPDFPSVDLPPGDRPLVFVAASTERDPELRLVRTAVRALADEPVRVIASTGGRAVLEPREIPVNAVVVDWAPYDQVMPVASLVLAQGGQGTLVRALAEGVPVLVCPAAVDMAGNGARVVWAGAGGMIPRRLLGTASMRAAVRRLLTDRDTAAAARAIGTWARSNDGVSRGADLAEAHVAARTASGPRR